MNERELRAVQLQYKLQESKYEALNIQRLVLETLIFINANNINDNNISEVLKKLEAIKNNSVAININIPNILHYDLMQPEE